MLTVYQNEIKQLHKMIENYELEKINYMDNIEKLNKQLN